MSRPNLSDPLQPIASQCLALKAFLGVERSCSRRTITTTRVCRHANAVKSIGRIVKLLCKREGGNLSAYIERDDPDGQLWQTTSFRSVLSHRTLCMN